MPKYEVELEARTSVEVEAANEDEAGRLAIELAADFPEWDVNSVWPMDDDDEGDDE